MSIDLHRQVAYAAVELGIADAVSGIAAVGDVAASIEVSEDALTRLMRGMAHYGLCRDHGGGRFELTDAGTCLRTDCESDAACDELRRFLDRGPATGMLAYSVRTGNPAFEHAFGMPFFEYTARDPAAGRRFSSLMAADTDTRAAAVAVGYDFSAVHRVVDVGGGHGALITKILKHHPQLSSILFDVEAVVRQAERRIHQEGLAARCDLVAGDFFESVPSDGDLYLYSQILHDWDDEECRTILTTCRRAVGPGGKVLLVEALMPERIERPQPVVELDLMMLMLTGGRERTCGEYRELLEQEGFQLTGVFPIDPNFSILEATPATRPTEKV